MEETVHKQLYLAHNALEEATEKDLRRDATLRRAIVEVLPAIRLFAALVEQLEQPDDAGRYRQPEAASDRLDYEGWIEREYGRARAGLGHVLSLVRALRQSLLGKLPAVRVMVLAKATRTELEAQLGLPGGAPLDSGRDKSQDYVAAYTWPRGSSVPVLKPRYNPDAHPLDNEVFNAHFRREFGRRPGRPKQYRDHVQAVLDAIRATPGMSVRALCRATKMKTAVVTAAYKQLVRDGIVRTVPGPRRSTLLVPVFPKPAT